MFQFQTGLSSIAAHRVVHMDNKIDLKFLSVTQLFLLNVMVELRRGNSYGQIPDPLAEPSELRAALQLKIMIITLNMPIPLRTQEVRSIRDPQTWCGLDTHIGTTTHLRLHSYRNLPLNDCAASREAILIELPVHFSDAPIGNEASISE
jgi:hypothetical protein